MLSIWRLRKICDQVRFRSRRLEGSAKRGVHLQMFVMEKDKMSIRTKVLGMGQPKLEELGMKRNR